MAVLFFFCGIAACSSGNEKKFESQMQKFGINITPETRAILQIDDEGCSNCNQSMINAFCRFKNDKNVFFLVGVDPNKLDISCFLENRTPNIIFCKGEDFENTQLEFNTKVFLLKNGMLDTIVRFNARDWLGATMYVNKVLSSSN